MAEDGSPAVGTAEPIAEDEQSISNEVFPQFSVTEAQTFAAAVPMVDEADDGTMLAGEAPTAEADVPGAISEELAPVESVSPSAVTLDEAEESELLYLSEMPPQGDLACYRVTGPLTFARIMALERALASLGGVTSSSVKPESSGAANISFSSDDPESSITSLLSVPGLALRRAAS
jgi:hypothetical protein